MPLCENSICNLLSVHTPFYWHKAGKTLIHAVLPLHVISENATVGEKIRFYRQKRYPYCNIFSDKIGLNRTTIMRYEKGEIEPDLKTLQKIAVTLSIPVDKLCDDYYIFLIYPYDQKIKELRKMHGLTQKQLGSLLEVSRRAVERWEKGINTVTRATFEKLCEHRLL